MFSAFQTDKQGARRCRIGMQKAIQPLHHAVSADADADYGSMIRPLSLHHRLPRCSTIFGGALIASTPKRGIQVTGLHMERKRASTALAKALSCTTESS